MKCSHIHINYVKMGKRNASPELTEKLVALVKRAEQASKIELERKPYRWKAGHDPRRHKSKWERYVTRKQKPTRSNQSELVIPAPTIARPNESPLPKDKPTDKLQEDELALMVLGRMCQRCKAQVRTQRVKLPDGRWEMLCPDCTAKASQPDRATTAIVQPARTPPQSAQPTRAQSQPGQTASTRSASSRGTCWGCQTNERPALWFPSGRWLCQWHASSQGYRWGDGKKRAEW